MSGGARHRQRGAGRFFCRGASTAARSSDTLRVPRAPGGIYCAGPPLARGTSCRRERKYGNHRQARAVQHSEGQHDHLPRLPCPRSRAGCHRGPIATRHRRHPIARCSSRVVSPTRHTWPASLRCRLPSIRMARQERSFGRRRQKGRKHSPAIDVPSQRPAAPAQPRQFGGFRTQPGTPR